MRVLVNVVAGAVVGAGGDGDRVGLRIEEKAMVRGVVKAVEQEKGFLVDDLGMTEDEPCSAWLSVAHPPSSANRTTAAGECLSVAERQYMALFRVAAVLVVEPTRDRIVGRGSSSRN